MHNEDKMQCRWQSDQNGPFSWPFESRCVIYCCIHQHKNQLVEESKSLHQITILLIRKKRKITPMLPPTWIMLLLRFRVGSSLYVIPKRVLQELEGPQRLLPPLESEHIEWVQTSKLAPISPRASP
jgi:hypothetical protein